MASEISANISDTDRMDDSPGLFPMENVVNMNRVRKFRIPRPGEGNAMHFRIEHEGDINLIHPVGNFDGSGDCEQLQTLITEIAESGCHKVVFSFSLTRWINSCGVGKLLAAKYAIDKIDGRFVICDLDERNMTIINTLRLDQIFEIHGSLQEAVEALGQESITGVHP